MSFSISTPSGPWPISLNYRAWLGTLPILGQTAISPQLTVDAHSGHVALDFPVYFATDDKGHLLGGLRFAYSTDGQEFVAGIFIDAPFSIFH